MKITTVDFILGALGGVVGNALTSLLSPIVKLSSQVLADKLGVPVVPEPKLRAIFQDAVMGLAEVSSFGHERVVEFLTSPEVETMLRQLFATQLIANDPQGNISSIRHQFSASLALTLSRSDDEARRMGDLLFDRLVTCCDVALSIALDQGMLPAIDAKEAYRFRLLQDLVQSIQSRQESLIEILTASQKPAVHEIIQFEQEYRRIVGEENSFITPPNFDKERQVHIDALYVAPAFIPTAARDQDSGLNRLSLEELLFVSYRCVILGDPGGGKSTLTKKLAHDLSVRYSDRLFGGRELTPIVVTLRDYAEQKKQRGLSILQFIEFISNSDQQSPAPEGAFLYLLTHGRALVIFDGLDELLITADRKRVSQDVQNFCKRYLGVPVIVTSRKVGYDQAPLDPTDFEVFVLAAFTDAQVKDYATKWFSTMAGLRAEQKRVREQTFLDESATVADLRSNPLMLALMCNIYWRENYIPQNRPQVYRKCATMLFQQWDSSRNIDVPASFEAHLETTIQYLAFWIYANPDLQAGVGVTEIDLVEKAADYLCDDRYEDRVDAKTAARSLINYCCKGRAWVFSDVGTSSDGEPLYKFTHQTFLEYFTAGHLLQTCYTPALLWEFLVHKIAANEWDMVAQLAVQLLVRPAQEVILNNILDAAQIAEEPIRSNYLSFLCRSLAYLQPKTTTTRKIVDVSIAQTFNFAKKRYPGPRDERDLAGVDDLIAPLFACAAENRPYVLDTLHAFLTKCLTSEQDVDAEIGFEFCKTISWFLNVPDEWLELADGLCEQHRGRIVQLAHDCLYVCRSLFEDGLVTLREAVQWHGLEFLSSGYSLLFARGALIDIVQELAGKVTTGVDSLSDLVFLLQQLGDIIQESDTPPRVHSPFRHARRPHDAAPRLDLRDKPAAVFGLFFLLAAHAEDRMGADIDWLPIRFGAAVGAYLSTILRARLGDNVYPLTSHIMDGLGFDTRQRKIVERWVKQQVSFLAV